MPTDLMSSLDLSQYFLLEGRKINSLTVFTMYGDFSANIWVPLSLKKRSPLSIHHPTMWIF